VGKSSDISFDKDNEEL